MEGPTGNKIEKYSQRGKFSFDKELKSQIRNAAISITSNIAKGFERDNDRENIQFFSYAKGSAGEVRSQLYNAHDFEYISKNEFKELHDLLILESKMLSGLIGYVKKSGFNRKKRIYYTLLVYCSLRSVIWLVLCDLRYVICDYNISRLGDYY